MKECVGTAVHRIVQVPGLVGKRCGLSARITRSRTATHDAIWLARERGRAQTAVAFSPVGRAVAGASPGGRVRVMDPDTGRVMAAFEGHAGDVTALAFARDGRRRASASADATVLIWSLPAP